MYNNSQDNHLIMYSWRPERRAAIEKWYYITTMDLQQRLSKASTHRNELKTRKKKHKKYAASALFFGCGFFLLLSADKRKMARILVVHSKVRKSWNRCTRHYATSPSFEKCFLCVNFSLIFVSVSLVRVRHSSDSVPFAVELFIQVKDYNSHGFPHLCHTNLIHIAIHHVPRPVYTWERVCVCLLQHLSKSSLHFCLPSDKIKNGFSNDSCSVHCTRKNPSLHFLSRERASEHARNGWIVLRLC